MKRQLAKLEAEVARKTREEMSGAIAKVREIMTTFGLTVEHLTSGKSSSRVKSAAGKKTTARKPAGKRAGAGTPKYRDPKTGATWTGFGRAPGWIASAKSRDAFLIGGHSSETTSSSAPAKAAASKRAAKKAAAKAGNAAKKVGTAGAKKSVGASVKATGAAPAVAVKKASTKKAASKRVASKKGAAKSPKAAAKKSTKPRVSAKSVAAATGTQGAAQGPVATTTK